MRTRQLRRAELTRLPFSSASVQQLLRLYLKVFYSFSFGSGTKRKTNVQKIKETFSPKQKKVPNKFKGFSKLPEKVQQKIDAKLAKKV